MPDLNANQFVLMRGQKLIEGDIANTIRINQHYHDARVREGSPEHAPLRSWGYDDARGIAARFHEPGTRDHDVLSWKLMDHGASHIKKLTGLPPQVRPGVVHG